MTDLPVLSTRSLVTDRWDDERFADALRDLPSFAAEGEALCHLLHLTGEAMWADVFAALDQVTPALADPTAVDPEFAINYRVIAELIGVPEFTRLRTWTKGDAFASATAAVSLRPTLEVIYDREQTTERMRRALEEERLAAEDDEPDDEAAEALAAQEARDAGERLLDLRSTLGRAAAEAEAAAEVAALVMPGGRSGDLRRLPAARRLALAKRLNHPRFQHMAEVFGALSVLMGAARRHRVPGIPADTGEIEYGRDLTRVLPSSLMLMSDPAWRPIAMAAYVDGRLPMVERRGAEERARGGIICEIDNSISMAGDPEERAKAMGLVLLNQCREQSRPFYGIHFADRYTHGPNKGDPQLLEFDFTQPYTAELVLDFAEFFFAGYTNFVYPLDRALALLEADHAQRGATDSDIVFISDGKATVTDAWAQEWTARMNHVDARLWVLLVDRPQREPLESLALATGGAVATFEQITDPGVDLQAVLTGLVR